MTLYKLTQNRQNGCKIIQPHCCLEYDFKCSRTFQRIKALKTALHRGPEFHGLSRNPCEAANSSSLLETPLIGNIWGISPQQLSWLEEWKSNISNILYMEGTMAKHINTNSHGLWHSGIQLCQSNPTASATERYTCHLFGSI